MNQEKNTLLIIEDEDEIRTLYVEVLRDAGFEMLEAKDGRDGYDKIVSEKWDLLLLDIMLPSMDGVQILKEMHFANVGEGRPVILLTNLGSENVINECFNYGADGYLIKSEITPDKIVSEVKAFLKKQ
ncbi:MAG: response regulator [Patescibacteria group bacterium]|jgi:DNA-binding response OmpR family regulator